MEALMALDGNILLAIQDYVRTPFLTPFFTFITHLGDAGKIWILLTILLLIPKKTRNIGAMSACALLLSLLINNGILKNAIHRVRPYEAVEGLNRLIEKQKDFSFPSGHTASSFAAAGVLLFETKKRYGIPAIIFASLIALSRLYVGVHYLTDVLFAVASGFFCAFAGMKIVEFCERKKSEKI